MKFRVIVADCPFRFSDTISMSDTKRGAEANYSTMSTEELKSLQVKDLAEDDSVLAFWCPSSMLTEGLEIMKSWGFRQTQTHIWVKTKKFHLSDLAKNIFKLIKSDNIEELSNKIQDIIERFDLNNILSFGMGRLFRQTHELVLVGVRGKIYNHLENKSQRSVHFYPATKHSVKPELLQDMLENMFPADKNACLELFARRNRKDWFCAGNELPQTLAEDVRDSITRLKNL